MAADAKTLEDQALQLTPEERVRLADRLLSSLFDDQAVEAAWIDEVERRIEAIEQGRSPLVPVADSIAKARAAIK